MNILSLYKKLLKKYGKQNWWPADSQYEVVVGALLTQNTNWKNVEKSIQNLNKEKLLSPEKILKLNSNKLKKLIKPSGFFNQKAPRLKELTKKYLQLKFGNQISKFEMNHHFNEVKNKKLNTLELRKEFLSVKGVGKETADSIVLYAFNKPIFVIDSYTKRFCKFYSLFEGKDYEDYRSFFEDNLPGSVPIYKEYHALIVEWGKKLNDPLGSL